MLCLGKVDLVTCEIMGGTQILPLKHKIFSGYNDEVAIRRLVDLTDEQREMVHDTIMKVSGGQSRCKNNKLIKINVEPVSSSGQK